MERKEMERVKTARGIRAGIGSAVFLALVFGAVLLAETFQRAEEPEPLPETEESRRIEPVAPIILPSRQEPETAVYEPPVDFGALAEVNPEVAGYIRIEGTGIDYPIVYRRDYDYYLHHDFQGRESAGGTIFLDFESDGKFGSRHNVIYGHRMKDGSMFKDVIRFRDEDFFREHQYFSIYTPEREIRLKAVACFWAPNSSELRRPDFKGQEDFDRYAKSMIRRCDYAGAVEYPLKALYTLITCSYEVEDARTLLMAVEVDENGTQVLMHDLMEDE